MTAESGLPWNSPFARCTACVSHCFVEMTAVRSVYSKWIVRRPGLAGQMVTPQRIDNEVVVDGPRCICKVQPVYCDVVLVSCFKDSSPQFEFVLPGTPSKKAF